MRFAFWLRVGGWLLFGILVYWPIAQLATEAIALGGGIDLSVLLLSGRQLELLGTSVILALGTGCLAVLIGVPYAFLCARTDLPGRAAFSILFLLPLLIPPYIHAIVWGRLLANNGVLNRLLVEELGVIAMPLDVHSLGGVIFVLALSYFPFVSLLTLAGLKSIDRNAEEAALIQAGPVRTVFGVTLPLVTPHILAGTLFVFVFSLSDFAVGDILRVQLFPVEIFIQFSALYDEQAAIWLSLPFLVLTVIAITLQVWTMRGRSYVTLGVGHEQATVHGLGRIRWVAFSVCTLILVLSVVVPIAALAEAVGPWRVYFAVLRASAEPLLSSVGLALLAAFAMVLVALVIAVSIHSCDGRLRVVLEYFSQMPFAIPPVVLGIGLIKAWNRPGLDWVYTGSGILVIAYIAHFMPFVIRVIYASLQQINPRLFDAATLSGASGVRIGIAILVPLAWDGLLAGFFVAFVLAVGELGVTLLVTPPGTTPIPIKIYNFMHYGAEDTVAALCLILIAIQLMVGLLLIFARRIDRMSRA